MLDGLHGIRNKFGITFKFLEVWSDQGQLCDDIFNVMDHERRQAIEGLELPGFCEGLAGPQEIDISCRLESHCLQ